MTRPAVRRIWEHSVLPYVEERLFGDDEVRSKFSLDALRGEASRSSAGTDEGLQQDSGVEDGRGAEEQDSSVEDASD